MQIGHQRLGSIDHGHGLDVHFTRSCNAGVEQAFATQEDIFRALDCLNVHGAALAHGCQITGIHDDAFAHTKVIFFTVAIDLNEHKAVAADSLHNEALTAKKALT